MVFRHLLIHDGDPYQESRALQIGETGHLRFSVQQLIIWMTPKMTRLTVVTRTIHCSSPPVFLAPLLMAGYGLAQHTTQFSTSTILCKRKTNHRHKRDSTPDRGVSALRRTGLRHPVSMSKVPLPRPVLDLSKRKTEVAKNHGLWGFFNAQGTVLSSPDEDAAFGSMNCFNKLTSKADYSCCRSLLGC